MSDDELFSIGILQIAEQIVMSCNGSADPLDDETLWAYWDYLRRRRSTWRVIASESMWENRYHAAAGDRIDAALHLTLTEAIEAKERLLAREKA